MENYILEKTLWSDDDFETMSWHDNPIHAISFTGDFEIQFDIDYIFKWVKPKSGRYFKFWIAPCTLIFYNVYDIAFESNNTKLIIDNISRENPQRPKNADYIGKDFEFDWFMEATSGEFSFKSVGYKQYVRQKPLLLRQQELTLVERGGVSFEKVFFGP